MKKLFLIIILSVSVIIEADAQWSPFDWFSKPSFSPEAQQYFTRITNPPAVDTLRFYADCIDCMKEKGIYVLIDEFGFLAARNQQMALLGVKGKIDALAVSSPTFEVYRGYTGNGTSSYINTQFVISSHATNYTLNNASIGIYSRTDLAVNALREMGTSGASGVSSTWINSRIAAGTFFWRINSATNSNVAVSNSLGLFAIRRTSSTSNSAWQNGINLSTTNIVSDGLSPVAFYVLAENSNGTPSGFSTRQIAFWYIGGSLSDAQMLELFVCVETLMDKIGAGVVN